MSLPGLQALITNGYDKGGNALASFYLARNHLYAVGDQILANNWASAKTECYNAADDLGTAATHLLQDNIWNESLRSHWKDAFELIDLNWTSGASITMDDILTEMLAASFSQLTSFMGITQAYKVAVWDAPFNEEYYAALARGFRVWGA